MKTILALGTSLIVAGFATLGHCAQIAWDSVALDQYEAWDPPNNPLHVGLQIYYDSDGVLFQVTAEPDSDQIRISSYPGKNLAYWISSAFAEPGDIIDENSTQNLSGVNSLMLPNPESILVPTDQVTLFYIIFSTELWHKDDIYYGWIEMEYSNHEFSLVHSAVTTGGEPLTVGVMPIPEPSSAALFILGLAVAGVARCKRNRNTP